MPNHVHGVIMLTDSVTVGSGGVTGTHVDTDTHADTDTRADTGMGADTHVTKRHGLPEIVRGFKTFSSRRINQIRHTPGVSVWQRNYYERIVRDQRALDAIRHYILKNPQKWAEDANNLG